MTINEVILSCIVISLVMYITIREKQIKEQAK